MSIAGILFLIILFLLMCGVLWIIGASIMVAAPTLYLYVVQIFKMMFFRQPECHFTQSEKIILLVLNVLLAYFLLPVFVGNWAVLGGKFNHDVSALQAWVETCFFGTIWLAYLPLLRLFQAAEAKQKWAWQCSLDLWRMIWLTFFFASALMCLNALPFFHKMIALVWQWAYAWWDNVFLWLEIGTHTRQHFYQPQFRYAAKWWWDLASLLLFMLPLYGIISLFRLPEMSPLPRKMKIKR